MFGPEFESLQVHEDNKERSKATSPYFCFYRIQLTVAAYLLFIPVVKPAKQHSRIVSKPSFPLVHLVSVSLSLLLSMTLPLFHQARITDTYRLLCHLWQAMLSYASCRLLYRIQRWSFFSLEQEREFPSLALSFRFGFSHLYELNLGNNKKAAGNNACGFAAFAVFLLTAYSTINFLVVLPIAIV